MIKETTIVLSPKEAADKNSILKKAAAICHINVKDIKDYIITHRAVDARKKPVKINLSLKLAYGDDDKIDVETGVPEYKAVKNDAKSIIIIGAGPAGLFAALKAIELGFRPILLERGSDVEKRRVELAKISRESIIDPDSNYSFGEGGAGAFSDGKLFTRSKKRGNVKEILRILHHFGASEEILVNSHPHIGSDKLPQIIKNIRNKIIECGGEVYFNKRVSELIVSDGKATGVKTSQGETFMGDAIIMATGHSARDIYRMLSEKGIRIEAKGLAMGVRLEHPQHLIDQLQYHDKEGRGEYLPAAEYSFVTQADGRGVYSFCMCPGGVVVPAMTDNGQLVVNGMSASARSGKWANSGIVVELHPGDIKGFEKEGPLEMMALQEHLEKIFYEESGRSISAPAQRMTDFCEQKKSKDLPASSYAPGIHSSRLDLLFPDEISKRLKKGLIDFDKKCKGFMTPEGIMIGLESRTSSPVRIPRDPETLEHPEIKNLYPAGEGAGFAGGIVSAAIDGGRCVEAFSKK